MRDLFSTLFGPALLLVGVCLLLSPLLGDTALPDNPTTSSPRPLPLPVYYASSSPLGTPLDIEAYVAGPVTPDGMEAQCDLPSALHTHNVGGSDGAGLCVFCSMRHTGLWAHDPVFTGLFDYMKKHPGGGYPEKVDKMIAAYCKEAGLAKPNYIQIEGQDLDTLELACQNGFMPGVTYNHSPSGRYGGQRIAHMVSLVGCTRDKAGNRWWCVLDNNYVKDGTRTAGHYEWLSESEFKSVKPDWAIVLLKPGPPPPPRNPRN